MHTRKESSLAIYPSSQGAIPQRDTSRDRHEPNGRRNLSLSEVIGCYFWCRRAAISPIKRLDDLRQTASQRDNYLRAAWEPHSSIPITTCVRFCMHAVGHNNACTFSKCSAGRKTCKDGRMIIYRMLYQLLSEEESTKSSMTSSSPSVCLAFFLRGFSSATIFLMSFSFLCRSVLLSFSAILPPS